jgi:ribose transport system permease protein
LCSVLAAFAGLMLASRLGAAQATAGGSYALDSVAAVVLGGTALSGGKGNMLGSFLGIAILGTLQTGLIMIQMPVYYQFVATGLVLIIAVLLQTFEARSKKTA